MLLFLVWDVLSAAWEPIDAGLTARPAPATLWVLGALFVAGLGIGLAGLAQFERRWMRRTGRTELPPRRLALLIAIGIGLHNFAEGLAIGQSASSGHLALASVLVVGFALHNATEGFGIVSPLTGDERPSWKFLLLLGAIGGGPTLIGTLVGSLFVSEELAVLFLSLAAGSIVYVVIQLLGVLARAKRTELVTAGVLVGMIAGFATDAILTAGGA